jgi:hypothetical protein
MRLYPLAMKCYLKTMVISDENFLPENEQYTISGDFILPPITSQDEFQDNDHLFMKKRFAKNNSGPISNSNITESFNDGKKPVAYAVIIHVKQPITGKRKPFTGFDNVGHMFITLIKYNSDSSCISRSFGFYPKKDNLLSATPLRPVSSSVFKDDALHDWDEAIGKFISQKRFEKIIRLIAHYDNRNYHLNKNNCTDFGLYAANIAGISVENTRGNWPLGSGNNPANAGQSILEGRFMNADTRNIQGLFICADSKDR